MGGDLFISALYPQSSVESFPDPNKQLNMLPTENHDDAITAADQLVIDSVFRCVADTKASAHNISFASAPVFGVNWNRKVIARITIGNRSGTDALNQILCKMRNSPLPRSDYERAGDLLKKAFVAPAVYLHEWEEWRVITERYRMGRRREWAALEAVVARLASAGLNSPSTWPCLARQVLNIGSSTTTAERPPVTFGARPAFRLPRRRRRII